MSNQALALKRSDELGAQAASLAAKEQISADEECILGSLADCPSSWLDNLFYILPHSILSRTICADPAIITCA